MVQLVRTCRSLTLMAAALLGIFFSAMAQIPEKEEAKAAKVTYDLYRVITSNGIPNQAPTNGLQRANLYSTEGNTIAIDAAANSEEEGAALLQALQALGLQKGILYKQRVAGYLPIDKLVELKNIPSLRIARPSYKPKHNVGSVTSQGDVAMRANIARSTYSVTGAGVKVGILSDSYNARGGAAAGVASGDLPTGVQVLVDLPSTDADATDEGRGMAELVHDVAPGAAIAFATAYNTELEFAQNIRSLATAGCKIITDDVGYFAEPFFQDGVVAQAIDDVVTNHGVTYFSSAGNSARSSYQSAFNPSTPAVFPGYSSASYTAHNFGGGDTRQTVTVGGGRTVILSFQWDDPFFSVSGGTGARTDMDILVYYNGAIQASLSGFETNTGGDPVEVIGFTNNGSTALSVELVLVKYSGPNPTIVKWVNFGSTVTIEYDTKSSTTAGHPNSSRCIAVGAAPYFSTPAYNGSLTTALIENFSSAGGTPILFNTAGTRITQIVRQKPEITAVDGTNTSFFYPGQDYEGDGFPNFFGTSAAAPHAAAVAALMKEKVPAITAATILSTLESTALDMDDPSTPSFDTGFDYGTGFGFIQADRALQAIAPVNTAPTVANAIPPQSATVGVGFTYTIPANTFTDAETPNSLVLSVSGLPPGLNFTAPATISGTPSTTVGSPFTVTVKATDPGSLTASTTFTITVNPAAPTPPTNTPPTVANAIPPQSATVGVAFTYNIPANTFTDAETPNSLVLSVSGLPPGLNFTAPATISGTPSTTVGSPFTVTVKATDPGSLSTSTTFTITVNPAAPMPPSGSFAIVGVTTVSCTTISAGQRSLTFNPQYSGTTGQPISFSVANESLPTTAPGPYTLNLYTDNPVIILKATQTGTAGEASFNYNWLGACGGPTPPPSTDFTIVGVTTVSCNVVSAGQRTVTFTPQYSGTTGQPISFSVVNELLPMTAPGPYTLNLYTDNPVIVLKAAQTGTATVASYTYNWFAACGSSTNAARLGVSAEGGLSVRVLGNPVPGEVAEIEIKGTSGVPVAISLLDAGGRVMHEHRIAEAAAVERVSVPIKGRQGLLLLTVSTPTERKTIKLIKQ